MPRMFKKKNLHLCFFKIKCLPTSFSPPLTLEDDEDDIIYTHNILINDNKINTNNNPSSIMVKNYNSIYDLSIPSSTTFTTNTTTTNTSFSSASLSTSTSTITDDYYDSHPLDFFPTVSASRRFFVSSPGRSNSILDSSTVVSPSGECGKRLVGGGVPVKKNSSDPYGDFRRSIKDMIDARECEKHELGVHVDGDTCEWEFLQELLLCYLTLNPKNTHKFIVGAFSDVLVSMMSNDGESRRLLPFVTEPGF